jgi:hypothetical protein
VSKQYFYSPIPEIKKPGGTGLFYLAAQVSQIDWGLFKRVAPSRMMAPKPKSSMLSGSGTLQPL